MDEHARQNEDEGARLSDGPHSDPDRIGADHPSISREWLVTNGLGGYASGTVSGFMARRFHGLLIAALPAPQGRTMMLNYLSEKLRIRDRPPIALNGDEHPKRMLVPSASRYLVDFRLDSGLPVWTYQVAGLTIEKRLCLPHGQNTTLIAYHLLEGDDVRIELQPWVHFRRHEGALNESIDEPYALTVQGDRYEICKPGVPPLRLQVAGPHPIFTIAGDRLGNIRYRTEESRGYDARGDLHSPGYFGVDLVRDSPATVLASVEPWEIASSLEPVAAFAMERLRRTKLIASAPASLQVSAGAELVLAADQFVITPAGRLADAARAKAGGDEIRTIIAGYHWFTDWGRDTMISLEGLTLSVGRVAEAAYVLRTFAYYVRDGLIPNMFPEGNNAGLYHTADATLWYFHAIDRYLETTKDVSLLRHLLPTLRTIVAKHLEGTRFGIAVDPKDGLLRQGEEGYQLTWMDAKVGDYVVTPRRGKAVEICALWYNALLALAGWERQYGEVTRADELERHAALARSSFNRRFWYEPGKHLYDVVDGETGDDNALRPNQLLAISLKHPILEPERWESVVNVVRDALLTPVGLRTLAPSHPEFRAKYFGDLHARDTAYHQGTVWAWLIGPFVDAWLKVYPESQRDAQRFLQGFVPHLAEAGVGTISEIFDATPPFSPRGCVAQAWSVAEVLRLWIKTSTPVGADVRSGR
ncbi:MAG TPA: amylo-alpha-1,6-glucosidase [Polyangiaceae bacterium]|nr:amylo-alpha-1,6-glucosidase [Polyangiaceae bacterium]